MNEELSVRKRQKVANETDGSNQSTENEPDSAFSAQNVIYQAEKVVKKIINAEWNVCPHSMLPEWLQDNDFLFHGHRPPLPSFSACFRSVFRIHTETGNIWTHLVGCLLFICLAVYFLNHSSLTQQFQEKMAFGVFFLGAIACLGCSCIFHIVCCHSQAVSKVFSKLDYCGIAMLIVGSFVPWLYYGFYCHFQSKLIYLIVICTLGVGTIFISSLDRFSEPSWRSFRAGLFIVFGLTSVVPVMHYGFVEGWFNKVSQKSVGWLVLMGILYIFGAILYAVRVPERFFPGKFDIWLHSHQLFHLFVIGAALVHLYGMSEMAAYITTERHCDVTNDQVF